MSQSIPPKPNIIFSRKVALGAFLVTTLLTIPIWVINDSLVSSPRARLEEAGREMATAQTRWDARPFSHYRFSFQISSEDPDIGVNCQRDLEILNEKAIHVYRNDCPDWAGGMSVTDIFSLFARYTPFKVTTPSTPRPGVPTPTPYIPKPTPTGPRLCGSVLVASFDPEYGYPHPIKNKLMADDCTLLFTGVGHTVEIISLTPLP